MWRILLCPINSTGRRWLEGSGERAAIVRSVEIMYRESWNWKWRCFLPNCRRYFFFKFTKKPFLLLRLSSHQENLTTPLTSIFFQLPFCEVPIPTSVLRYCQYEEWQLFLTRHIQEFNFCLGIPTGIFCWLLNDFKVGGALSPPHKNTNHFKNLSSKAWRTDPNNNCKSVRFIYKKTSFLK